MSWTHRAGWYLVLLVALLPGWATGGLFDRPSDAVQGPRVLPAEQAFRLTATASDPYTLKVQWRIEPGYYLYRDKFQLELVDAQGITLASTEIPAGELKDDPYFGPQPVFHEQVLITARLQRSLESSSAVEIKVHHQGCAEAGVCYPPLSQTVAVALPAPTLQPVEPPSGPTSALPQPANQATAVQPKLPPAQADEPEPDRLARLLTEQRFLSIPAFFGFGLLLAFTPCVFPMVPILSSLIAGQGANLTRRRALLLALTYVLSMSLTYTIIGILAALLGQNIQAWFQNPWVIGAFSGLFVLLALSMFGLYELQLPTSAQHRLIEWSNRQSGGHYTGVAVMGLLSALIIGPCVAPPLIGILTFIAVTGDLLSGAVALFVLSLGMGTPLLILGASAGHWLPHAGHWMERIKAIFGVLLLGVALWLLERILPAPLIMVLWALLCIVTATWMGALQSVAHGAPAWRMLVKGLGIVLLIYGVLLMVGMAAGGRDPWQPLRGLSFISASARTAPLFRPVKTVAEVEQAVREAGQRPVLLDFYADWCSTCKEMERFTFSDPGVQATLATLVALQADVTAHDAADRALLKHFDLVGPPALLLFDAEGRERRAQRVVGFVDAPALQKLLRTLQSN